jgi:hypothetical protein
MAEDARDFDGSDEELFEERLWAWNLSVSGFPSLSVWFAPFGVIEIFSAVWSLG